MKVEDLFRVDERLRNGLNKYYLVCELFAGSKKFAASHLIKTGTKPTKTEIVRTAGMFGFDLETNTINKSAKFSSEKYCFDKFADDGDFLEFEKYRYLTKLYVRMFSPPDKSDIISRFQGVTFTKSEISKMFESGKIPDGKYLPEINLVQNISRAADFPLRKKLTVSSVVKIRKLLYNNFDANELKEDDVKIMGNILAEFNKKISENFHPLEQCMILFEVFTSNFSDRILASFMLYKTAELFGYTITPDISSWDKAVDFVKSENERLERLIRKKISSEFRVASGARQRQLDCF